MLNNNATKKYLMDTYNFNNYCKGNYIFVVYDKYGDTYKAIFLRNENIAPIVELSQASRGKGARLRYRQTIDRVSWLIDHAYHIDTLVYGQVFRDYANILPNRGERAEYFIYEKYSDIDYRRNNIPFYEGADIVLTGIPYQIKYHDATVITQSTADRLNGL